MEKSKNTIVALLLAFFIYPLAAGYFYLGKMRKAFIWLGAFWLAIIFFVVTNADWLLGVIFIGVFYTSYDCYRIAKESQPQRESMVTNNPLSKSNEKNKIEKTKIVEKPISDVKKVSFGKAVFRVIIGIIIIAIICIFTELIFDDSSESSSKITPSDLYLSESLPEAYNHFYSSELTDLQRDTLWKTKYEDKYVRWSAYVKSVEKRGLLTENDLMGVMNPSSRYSQVGVKFKKSELPKLLSYNLGAEIHFEGRLDSQGTIIGSKIFYVKDAVIIDEDISDSSINNIDNDEGKSNDKPTIEDCSSCSNIKWTIECDKSCNCVEELIKCYTGQPLKNESEIDSNQDGIINDKDLVRGMSYDKFCYRAVSKGISYNPMIGYDCG